MFMFAYGSNMNPIRMKERGCNFSKMEKGILRDFDICFNKKSKNLINTGFANLRKSSGSYVEGILYTLSEDDIYLLDKFEGYPRHYIREKMKVESDSGIIDAIVYTSSPEWISNSLRPTREYLQHLLEAKDFLSDEYFNRLKSMLTVDI